ncbi:MAG: peptide ABC transporter substrate-binding protein [Treponema sp.]|nr:peptide ABC transporter substrate-binding protein [Treponema sp.]
MIRRFWKSVISLVGVSALCAYLFCADIYSKADFYPEDQRTVVMVDTPTSYDLNPQTACYTSEAQIATGLYEGLFTYNPVTLEPDYALCTSYTLSRNQKRWTFTIRKDAKFSDGEPITAQTIKDSWMRLLANPNAPFSSMIDCISGAEEYRTGKGSAEDVRISVRSNTTLVVYLREPTNHLPRILCHHSFSAVSTKDNAYSGPFALKSYEKGRLEMVKNEHYYDAANVVIPGVTVIQSDDTSNNTFLYNTGKADWITGDANAQQILNKDSLHVNAEFGTSYLFFKIKNQPWNNAEFRQALLEALPYKKLRKDYTIPATTLVYPLSGYPNVVGLEDYDIEDAKLMMQDARKKAGIPQDQKITLTFAIIDSQLMQKWASILKKAWEPLGVSLVVQTSTISEYNPSIPGWDADLFSYSWIGDYADPLAFLELFRGGSSLNVAGYANAEYDSLLREASLTKDSSERYKILAKAEQMLLDDSMVIPISHPVSLNFINLNRIGGWTPNALDLHPFKYLYIRRKIVVPRNVI